MKKTLLALALAVAAGGAQAIDTQTTLTDLICGRAAASPLATSCSAITGRVIFRFL
jgi:hypothetical protein